MVTLASFIDYTTGKHNVGQLKVSADGNGLEKVNNHIHFTSKNNVRLTGDENRRVREALVEALSNETDLSPEKIDAYRQLLLGGSAATKSLSRDFAHAVIEAAQRGEEANRLAAVDKRLRDRKITTAENGDKVYTAGVKSQDEVAYEIHHNERLDASFGAARDAYDVLKSMVVSDGDVDGFVKMCESESKFFVALRNAIFEDERIDGDTRGQIDAALGDLRREITKFGTATLTKRTPGFIADWLKNEISKIIAKFLYQETIADDFALRLFGDRRFHGKVGNGMREQILALRNGIAFDGVKSDNYGYQARAIRAQMLAGLTLVIRRDASLPPEKAEQLRERAENLSKDGAKVLEFGNNLPKDPAGIQSYLVDKMREYFTDLFLPGGQVTDAVDSELLTRYTREFGLD